MKTGNKIAVTILVVVMFFVIGIFLSASNASGTFIAFLALGLFFGLRSMWQGSKDVPSSQFKLDKTANSKNKKEKKSNSDDS